MDETKAVRVGLESTSESLEKGDQLLVHNVGQLMVRDLVMVTLEVMSEGQPTGKDIILHMFYDDIFNFLKVGSIITIEKVTKMPDLPIFLLVTITIKLAPQGD